MIDVDALDTAPQQQVVAVGCPQIQVELGVAGILFHHARQFADECLVDIFHRHGNGETLQSLFLDIIQELYVLNFQLVDVGVAIAS